MGKKKKNNGKCAGSRFFRWMRSDLPDDEDKKSPVLLLGVNKITDSPSFGRRCSETSYGSNSIRFFRPPKSKYTRGLQSDARLEKIRQDLITHKNHDEYIPSTSTATDERSCLKLNCAGVCKGCEKSKSFKGSFAQPERQKRHSSLCPSEPYGASLKESRDYSESDIEFKYSEHIPNPQPGCSKQPFNVTPKSSERRHFLLANLNERFRKTLSLDSRPLNGSPLSLPKECRPKSLLNPNNVCAQYKTGDTTTTITEKGPQKKKRFRPKSFFSLETFFDRRSDTSSVDDFSSSKYKRFELECDDSPLFRGSPRTSQRDKTPDLLNLPVIIDSVKKQSNTKRQLEKLENHYYKSIGRTVIDAIPKDATDVKDTISDDDDVEYIEPIRSNFTSQSTLILDSKNIPNCSSKPDSVLTINTDDTYIRLPSSTTVSPKSDLGSIGAYVIEVRETDLIEKSNELTVKVMDKSVDSIGSCSLDVDASTDFSDTTSGSLNLLTPSSTTSHIRDFAARFQERATSANQPSYRLVGTSRNPTPDIQRQSITPTDRQGSITPTREGSVTPTDRPIKPPQVVISDTSSHRSRHKKREEPKKPSYLNLACSVNGYTNLTTYDSKLRQDINKSREASPIRPITHTYIVPLPSNRLHPTHGSKVTIRASAHSDTFMAENKLRNEFLGMSTSPCTDEVDKAKPFKSSYSDSNFNRRNGHDDCNGIKAAENGKENGEALSPMKSFIQQRVERLYGPGALAQGFYNEKRIKPKSQCEEDTTQKVNEDRLQDVDPNVSLPVLRHLRPEFRAQLPILSPKKSPRQESKDIPNKTDVNGVSPCTTNGFNEERDALYFIELKKRETSRLIALAQSAEDYLESLQGQEVSEEVLGLLRSASGKARLLATQKMQQFEGLCYNNINERADEQFPTTLQDLQGFWDMVCLQVRNVDALYTHLEELKANNWKEPTPLKKTSNNSSPRARKAAPVTAPAPPTNERARAAAERREAERRAMMEHRRRLARERQMAERASTHDATILPETVEGGQEVEIFVPSNVRDNASRQGDGHVEREREATRR